MNVNETASAVARGRLLMARGAYCPEGKGPMDFLKSLEETAKGKKEVTEADRSKWIQANWQNQEFASAVRYNIAEDVLAHMWTLGFFQLTTLAEAQWPILETVNRDGTLKCYTIGEKNGKKAHQFIDRRSHASHLLRRVSSPRVQYQLLDLQVGRVAAVDRVQAETAYELQLKMDAIGKTVLDAGITTGGSGLRATLNLHRSIVAANIPDSNYLDLNGTAPAGKWSIEKIKQVLDYFERFAGDVDVDGPLAISSIYMSTTNLRDIWDFTSVVSGFDSNITGEDPKDTISGGAKEQIYQTGKLRNVFGQPINMVTRNTISGGYAYVSSNKPVGFYWRKPSLDTTQRKEDAEKNEGEMSQTQVYAIALPDAWKYRVLKVKL